MNIQAVMVEKDSGRAMMSGFHGLFSLGGILGAGGMSGLLLFGVSPLAALFSFGLFALILLVIARPGLLSYGNAEAGDAPPFALPHGIVIFVGLLCFIVFLAEGSVLDWSALFLVSERAFDPAAGGYGYALFAVAMTTGRLLGDKIVARLGGARVITLGGLIAAAGFALPILVPFAAASLLGFFLRRLAHPTLCQCSSLPQAVRRTCRRAWLLQLSRHLVMPAFSFGRPWSASSLTLPI